MSVWQAAKKLRPQRSSSISLWAGGARTLLLTLKQVPCSPSRPPHQGPTSNLFSWPFRDARNTKHPTTRLKNSCVPGSNSKQFSCTQRLVAPSRGSAPQLLTALLHKPWASSNGSFWSRNLLSCWSQAGYAGLQPHLALLISFCFAGCFVPEKTNASRLKGFGSQKCRPGAWRRSERPS